MTGQRIVVVDIPGEPVALIAYAGADALARVEIAPLHALHLAGELIAAASRRLAVGGDESTEG